MQTIKPSFLERILIISGTLSLILWAGLLESLKAQREAPQIARSRITQRVSDSSLIRLQNTTHLRIRTAIDNGRVSPELPMERVLLTLKSRPEQEAELEQLLAQQQDPSSPQFHRWLSPQEFGDRFGASPEEIAAVTNWLQSHGFQIDAVANGRRQVEFSGTARQIEETFHTEIHHYDSYGEMHVANATDISIPEALTPVISGIVSLHDFRLQATSQIAKKSKALDSITPAATLADGSHILLPYDFATIYNVAPLWNQGIDGTGQSIAIVGRSNINLADIAAFRSQVGLPANNPQIILAGSDPGITNIGEEGEADLDVEWSGAVAKGATIKLVIAKSTNTSDGAALSAAYVVDNKVAPIVSASFGTCEGKVSSAEAQFIFGLWQQAAAQGMSVFVSSGDSGSAACDSSSAPAASRGLSVNAIASTPYNVAVGGTQFNENGSDSVYWNTTNNTSNLSSAKSYIPEVVWNEHGPDGIWSGGGGVSVLYPTPSWQSGYGVPSSDPGASGAHHRYVPDVSLSAAIHDGYGIVQEGSHPTASGTSASSPAFAGIMAMVNQLTNQANGNPNPRLYALAAQLPSAFHDITSGSNAVPCVDGSPNCSGGMLTGYSAGPGYDLATGWGSVDAYVLAHAWAASTPTPIPLGITSSSPLAGGQSATAYSQTLSASGGVPPYTWTVVSGTLPAGLALSATGVISGTPTTPGTYSFTVQVTDSAHTSVSQAFQVTISGKPSTGGPSTTARTYHVFPQFADGVLSNGYFYRTTLMISNPSSTASASCTLQLRGLSVPGFNSTYSVAASGWVIAATGGTQSFQSGYATLQCSLVVEAQLLYSYYDASGAKLSEATVFSSPPAASLQVLGDNRGGAQIAIAIANDADQSATLTIAAYDNTGNQVGSANKMLAARSNFAFFVNDLIPLLPEYYGQVQISSSDGTVSLIGLRYTGSVFTTIPGVIRSSLGATANTYHVFPQFADGQLSDGSYYRTSVLITNPSVNSGSCNLRLYGLTISGVNEFPFSNLGPGAWAATTSISSMQSIKSGYATLSCTIAVEAQLLYSYYSANGTKLSEATVFSSPSSSSPQLLADNRQGSQMALAIANDSDQAGAYSITAYDANNTQVATVTRQVAARSSLAAFLSDFFSNLPAGYYGKVIVSSTNGTASIIGLRFTGTSFTTIPETLPAAPALPAPTLTSISPVSGAAGTTVTATLTGTNFVSAGTTVQVSGSGITLGTPQVAGSTSLTVTFAINASAAAGNRTVTVTTGGGTSNSVNFTVTASTPAPTLTSISPTSGAAGTTVTATLMGSNFVSGSTTVQFSGSGVTVGTPQVTSPTSLTVAFSISATASTGTRTVTVTTNGGLSNSVNFDISAASKPFNQTQTERLIGTWTFTSKTTNTYRLNDVEASTMYPGEWFIIGTNQSGGLVVGEYSPDLSKFIVLDQGTTADKFYVFDFSGTNSVAGCYYEIQPPGSTNLGQCYPMTGTRLSSSAIIANPNTSSLTARGKTGMESGRNLILSLEALRKHR